jgi:hypothetical protein
MARLGDVVQKVRSKNAGPFWITIDIFCGSEAAFRRVESGLSTQALAKVLGQPRQVLKRFAIPDLNVVKISLPRPEVQGSRFDRDMHGAQWAVLFAEMPLR